MSRPPGGARCHPRALFESTVCRDPRLVHPGPGLTKLFVVPENLRKSHTFRPMSFVATRFVRLSTMNLSENNVFLGSTLAQTLLSKPDLSAFVYGRRSGHGGGWSSLFLLSQ